MHNLPLTHHTAALRSAAQAFPMRLTFMISGGVAGTIRGCRIDTARLPPPERGGLEALVIASGLVASFERFVAAARDRRQYDLAIERTDLFVHVSCDDASLPESARPLVAELSRRATPQPLTFTVPASAEGSGGASPAAGRREVLPALQSTPQPGTWGRFIGDVVARWEPDGRDMTLVDPFGYVDPRAVGWDAPAGAVVNGASIPRAFWSLIGGPFEGRFRNASVVHDVACVVRDRPWQEVHRMFHDACRCGGVGAAKASAMYFAVFRFGPRWTVEERRSIVAGQAHVERVVRDETPPAPTEADVRAVDDYFATHDVAPDAVPTLMIPGVGR